MNNKAIVALKDSNPENATNIDLFQDKKTREYTFAWLSTKKPRKKDGKGESSDLDDAPTGSKSQRDYPTQPPESEKISRTRSEPLDHSLKSSVTLPLGIPKSDSKTTLTGDKPDNADQRRRSIEVDQSKTSAMRPTHQRSSSITTTPNPNLKSPKHATGMTASAEDKVNKPKHEKEEKLKKRASKSSKHMRVFKCFFEDDVRLVTIDAKQLTVQYLLAQVADEYNRERLVIKFKDEDGDLIRITKQQGMNILCLLIRKYSTDLCRFGLFLSTLWT